MRKIVTLLIVLGISFLSAFAQNRNNEDEVVKIDNSLRFSAVSGQVLVKFADNSTANLRMSRGVCESGMRSVDSVLRIFAIRRVDQLCHKNPTRTLRQTTSFSGEMVIEHDMTKLYKITLDSLEVPNTFELIQALESLPEVEYAEPNYLVYALGNTDNTTFVETVCTPSLRNQGTRLSSPNDPLYAQQWGLSFVRLNELWAIDTAYAADRSDSPIIAILDTGVDISHPDLAGNIWTNPDESAAANGYDNDNNGFVDDLHGWDFINQTGDMHDFNSHGTHCAGIAAATGNNGVGIIGANPHAMIMPVSVLQSNGSGDIATIIQGVNYAANNGADIISMSFGTYTYSLALEQALGQAYQSAVIVAAAGNDGLEIDPKCGDPYRSKPMYPAALSFVFGVEASSSTLNLCNLTYRTCWSNYDCDGHTFSQFSRGKLYNYELTAPGQTILSTIPGGQYRNYNGTSMACPLVAGGIATLMHAKTYNSKEILMGDLINTSNSTTGVVDFMACYNAGEAPAQLTFVSYNVVDTAQGDGDGRYDAGETLAFYPTFRTTWGNADSIRYWLEMAEFEDTTIVSFPINNVFFGWPLSSYAQNSALHPVLMHIDSNVVDGRNINLVLKAVCANMQDTLQHSFSIEVENGVELGGLLTEDLTLYPNVHYIVSSPLIVADSVVLTIKPGTTLLFDEDKSISIAQTGRLYAVGTADSMITFTTKNGEDYSFNSLITLSNRDTICYANFFNFYRSSILSISNYSYTLSASQRKQFVNHCSFHDNILYTFSSYLRIHHAHVYDNIFGVNRQINRGSMDSSYRVLFHTNFVNNEYRTEYFTYYNHLFPIYLRYRSYQNFFNCNIIANHSSGIEDVYPLGKGILSISTDKCTQLYVEQLTDTSYYGSSKESIVRQSIFDFNHSYNPNANFGIVDLTNMGQRPNQEAHGVVWKVLVNGFDAQDEFDSIAPLGIGKHRFDVYFSRPMDTACTPMIAMGVRPPYTQHSINEHGTWNTDGTVYTVYFNINGNTCTDGLNRIYVANAKDKEHFVCPTENMRFEVQVAAAGSMSTEFMATAGAGKIDLEWNNNEVDFDDFLGYNMYRCTWGARYSSYWGYNSHGQWGHHTDTIIGFMDTLLINSSLILDTLYTDYDVEPGSNYFYYYRVMRSDLSEGEASRMVSAMPLSSIRGDANGDYAVNVLDVVATVSHITYHNPQPFVFESADVNADNAVNVLDVIGIINLILHPNSQPSRNHYTATYTIENGILYVDCPTAIAGVQFSLSGVTGNDISILEALNCFEHVSSILPNGDLLFMAYSCIGNCIPAGRHALLRIGNAGLDNILLSDDTGTKIEASPRNTTAIISSTINQLSLGKPYPNPFCNSITIPYSVNSDNAGKVDFTVSDILGRIIDHIEVGVQTSGEHQLIWSPKQVLTNGIYFIQMRANGLAIQSAKIIYSK